MLNGQVDDTSANIVVAQMLFLESKIPKTQLTFISHLGGVITSV